MVGEGGREGRTRVKPDQAGRESTCRGAGGASDCLPCVGRRVQSSGGAQSRDRPVTSENVIVLNDELGARLGKRVNAATPRTDGVEIAPLAARRGRLNLHARFTEERRGALNPAARSGTEERTHGACGYSELDLCNLAISKAC